MAIGTMGGSVLGISQKFLATRISHTINRNCQIRRRHSIVLSLVWILFFLPNAHAFVTAGSAAVSNAVTTPSPTRTPKCDRMFISSPDGARNGSFAAPILRNPEKYYHQCIYTFIAAENERVQIRFTNFNLRGSPPECNHEYLDLYTEVAEPTTELIKSPFGGRYCGRIVPRRRISMHRTLVVGFYTDETSVDGDVFQGTYEFLNASQYVVGTPTPNTVCSFTIYSDRKREGDILAPTYPGTYPKNLQCQYRFLGRKGQRVRLEFMDFDLFYGGAHCPFDVVKVYDGATIEAPPIGTFCGQQRNLVVYSSAENLLVLFNTLQRTADSQNRGFSGQFEFSERFVNLGFIGKNDGEHIRGTECDQKILSRKESNGTVYSPNYPFLYHPNIVCRYYIYGLQDAQYLEKVRVDFEKFEIQSNDAECTEGYLKIYLQGQEERSAVDEFDHVFCGQQLPPSVESEGPRLMMVFSSGSSQGQGFKAHYTFETDYKVPGTASPDGTCHFTYMSESSKTGDFNSPRYPANYPCNTHCEYFFTGLPGEQIKFVFNYFRTKTPDDIIGYNEQCTEDWLEIYELFPSGREHKMGRYCAKTAPGPIVSDQGVNAMKVILFTNDEGVASGFSATYNFLPTMSKFGDCGQNISGVQNGMVTTPGFPANYESHRQICNWYITVRPNHKVVLNFEYFLIEGDPSSRGCPGAVVRIWRDLVQPPMELCGETLNNDSRMIISASNVLKLSFITADKAVGSGGFKAIWTEVKDPVTKCDGFVCKINGFCISESLKCNRLMNCGFMDDSDEYNCVHPVGLNIYLVAGLSTGSACLATIILCVLCHRKRRRRRKKRRHGGVPPPFEPPRQKSLASPREIPGMHFISVDSV